MIYVAAVLVAIGFRQILGHHWREIGELKIRGEVLFLCVMVLVALFPAVTGLIRPLRSFLIPLWVFLMAVLVVLCIANTRLSVGFLVMAVGVLLNLIVVAANGGMPVSEGAARSAGGAVAVTATRAGDLFHLLQGPHTRLALLADVLPLPGLPGLRGIFSIGDVLMLVGIVIILAGFEPTLNRVASLTTR